MGHRIAHWIGDQAVAGNGDHAGTVFDPARGVATATVDFADEEVVDQAVQVADAASRDWGAQSMGRRMRVLFAFRELLAERKEELAAIVTAEHGKTLDDALGEVTRGLEVVEFACGMPHLLKGGYSEGVSSDVDSYSIRQPVGVAGIISPFNFPAMVPMWFFPIAIACGNSVLLKPSEKNPSASLWMAQLWAEAGLPPGVFNVVHGDKQAVDAILDHPDVATVSFVGSTPVARYVYKRGCANGKRVQALGGAKNHMIVLPDADLDLVADAAVSAGFGSAGERCMAISVVVAVDPIGDEVSKRIAERMARLTVGDGRNACDMGPLVTSEHRDRVKSYIASGADEGATLVVDGRELGDVDGDPEGYWLKPTLFDEVTTDMSIYRDEIFGPVLMVVRADNYDEALEIVNSSPYGNGAAIYTNDGRAARRFQAHVRAGMVGINVPIPVPMAYYSFGGWKDSLFGGTNVHGIEGVNFFTRTKTVTSRWPERSERGVDLGFPQMT